MSDEHQMLREKVTEENGFALYRQYAEKEAAAFIKRDLSTLKRWRRDAVRKKREFPYVQFGVDGVRYLGIHIADLIILGTGKWDDTPNENSSSETGGSPKGPARMSGTASASTRKPDKQLVSALAQQTFQKPKSV